MEQVSPQALEVQIERERLRQIRLMIEEALAAIDPALVGGSLSPGGLPGGTMVDRGTYTASGNYRAGDLVVGADGMTYVAVASSLATAPHAPPDPAYWRLIGGSTVPPPPDTYVYVTDADGAYLVDADGSYIWEPV